VVVVGELILLHQHVDIKVNREDQVVAVVQLDQETLALVILPSLGVRVRQDRDIPEVPLALDHLEHRLCTVGVVAVELVPQEFMLVVLALLVLSQEAQSTMVVVVVVVGVPPPLLLF
jgi:hypothetical protein